ncbi:MULTISPECIES: PhzF family phenazine biosynthesis protein [unclassified Lysobacter]|uniref:PhzF family phenazine biosynthesis protein n=1 Tax=unclassified Lysobacter TaxID=2635362 RepID=UPI0006F56980|nr:MULTISPECIES: PhzF family phenazine biosynthesis protein [unclassified Lysobacter]KRC38578.1 phenazine biosynthesis protein [Lysobacter sp. Root76]KRD71220.1 phenazine biosynthesis protein [Lysobacter sp. Root96]
MTLRRYLQLDVFADRPGAGNPLGVVLNADGLDSAAMQAFAAWTNLSETIFLLPPVEGADYRVRIFTPRQELAFAGHPSVGAAWAAIDAGLATPREGALVQDCAAGLLPVKVAGTGPRALVSVRAPRSQRIELADLADPAAVEAALATVTAPLPLGGRPPALWDNGARWWVLELSDAAAVRSLSPDLPAIATLSRACNAVGLAVYATADASDHQLAVRAFCPADNIPEDPVTGSVNASIGAQLAASGGLPGGGSRYVASQGRELGRDGRVEVALDDDGEIWIGGRVQAVIRGRADW